MTRAVVPMLLALALAGCGGGPADRTPLKQLYTPHFAAPPPAEDALTSLGKLPDRARAAIAPLAGSQGLVLAVSLLTMLAVAFDFRNPWNPRNADLLILQAIGWLFFNILGFLDRLHDPTSRNYMDWVFSGVVALTVLLLVRALRRIARPAEIPWRPRIRHGPLAALALVLVAANVATALYYPPDDAGYFVNIGAQRFRERGRLPYGDPLLSATPAAAYGPLLYLSHVPFQVALAPEPVNAESP